MRLDYLLVALVSFLVWTIFFLIMLYLPIGTSIWSLLLTFTLCCLVASIVFVLAKANTTEASARIEEYERKAREEYDQLKNINEIINRTMRQNNSDYGIAYNRFATRITKDIEIVWALKTYILWLVHQSAMGKLRQGDKEKAQKQIKETEQFLDDVSKDPISKSSKINDELTKLKKNYEKTLSGFKD